MTDPCRWWLCENPADGYSDLEMADMSEEIRLYDPAIDDADLAEALVSLAQHTPAQRAAFRAMRTRPVLSAPSTRWRGWWW